MQAVRALAVALVIAIGCTAPTPKVDRSPGNAHPLANAGTGTEVLVGTEIGIDATGSYDPDGQITQYEWSLKVKPAGVNDFVPTATPTATYTPNVAGTYTFEVTVTDNDGATDASDVTFIVDPPSITVSAGSDLAMMWQQTAYLSGSYSVDPATPATVSWSLVSTPARSHATLANAATLTPSFFLDAEGTFVARMTVTTQYSSAHSDVSVVASVPRQLLSYLIVDAEYSTPLDRFVIVSDALPMLHVLDPATGTEKTVALPKAPTSLSLAPNGLRAAVGEANAVSVVDLQTLTVTNTYTMPFEVSDLVFGADGRIHCIAKDLGFDPITTINTATGATSSGAYVDGYSTGRLHPDHTKMYVAVGAISPMEIQRFNVSVDPVTYVRQDPDHGTYQKGSYLWLTADGTSIITPAGNVFYSSDNSAVDLTFRKALDPGLVNWAEDSPLLGKVAIARTTYDTMGNVSDEQLAEITDTTLTPIKTISIPDTPSGSMTYRSKGKYIGIRANATKIYVIASATSSLFALYTFDP